MKTSLHLAALCAGALAAMPPALAQDASHVASTVQSGTYAVEPGHTQVGFSLLHLGFSYYSGVFSGVSGTLRLDPAHLADTKLDVTIPIASVSTTSAKLDGELKSPAWFDAAAYPNATFVSTKVTPMGKDPRPGRWHPHPARRLEAGDAHRDLRRRRSEPARQEVHGRLRGDRDHPARRFRGQNLPAAGR